MKKEYHHSKSLFIFLIIISVVLSFFIIGIIMLIYVYLWYKNEVIVLTEKSVVIKKDFLKGVSLITTHEIPYSKISNIQIESMGGYDNVRIFTGNDIGITFEFLEKDIDISEQIYAKIALYKESKLIENNHQSQADEISKLAKLRDDGILTEEEFLTKKKQILEI
jgi:hypothetical protein